MVGLLEVQRKALEASKGKRGFAFWLEMGLGKTLTALTEFMALVEDGHKATRLVVVCPNSFKSGWRDEILKHGIEADPWVYQSGGDNDTFLRKKFTKPPVLIVNYEAIRRVGTQDYIYKFINNRNCMIVFDESIQIKTHDSQQTKAAMLLAKSFHYVRILSGKPMTQGPHDLWGQLRAIGQLQSMNFWAFRGMFCRMGGYLNKKVIGAQNEELLANMINSVVFKAQKSEWIDLPPKIYTTREVRMEGQQAQQYKTMEQEFVTWLENDDAVSVDMAITKHIKLAQIQSGFIIDEDGTTHSLVADDKNPRLNALLNMLDEEVVGKTVVVYHHRYVGTMLEQALHAYHPVFIKGGMTPEELANARLEFNKNPNKRVICIQTTAGRYGHTLVGGKEPENQCSTMVFFENTWSLDTRSQLEDRIHRIGQVGESCLYVDIVSSPLDRKIVNALQFKQNIYDAVMQHVRTAGVAADPVLG